MLLNVPAKPPLPPVLCAAATVVEGVLSRPLINPFNPPLPVVVCAGGALEEGEEGDGGEDADGAGAAVETGGGGDGGGDDGGGGGAQGPGQAVVGAPGSAQFGRSLQTQVSTLNEA